MIKSILHNVWERTPTNSYGSQNIELPALTFVTLFAFLLIPLPLTAVYSGGFSFIIGCTSIFIWCGVLILKSVQLKLKEIVSVRSSVKATVLSIVTNK